ncbi:MAG TPA: flagellar basal body-associated FliL family protein [Anaerolineae bacterium]|nr:flagellar basal body-associated FliL family protein [Anaerolineae bacterium]
MKKFLTPKIMILATAALVLLAVGATVYILFAPNTWWKPIYVEWRGDEAQAAEATTPSIGPQPTTPPQGGIPQGPQPLSSIQSGQPTGVMYKLDPKVVNLAEPGGLRYLQVSMVLEIWPLVENYYTLEADDRLAAEERFQELIDSRRPVIDDIVTTILSSKQFNDVASIEGKQELKNELTEAINNTLGYQGVINVYFTEFVVQ